MAKIKCLIIEDEPLAADLIASYVEQISQLQLVEICHKAIDALQYLQQGEIDLIFLDLHLPGIKGFDFLKTLDRKPKVIVTTAYHQYALEGYEMNVVDFLVKPIEFTRFLKAVNKASKQNISNVPSNRRKTINFTENRIKVPVNPDEINFIESQGDYLLIHLNDRIIKTKMTLQSCLQLLPVENFIRIHRSFIISKQQIQGFDSAYVIINNKKLPIGRNYRVSVMEGL